MTAGRRRVQTALLALLLPILAIFVVVGCQTADDSATDRGQESESEESGSSDGSGSGDEADESENTGSLAWEDVPLKDVRTGKGFKISDFRGQPVLVESFAVWCPQCRRQQDEIVKLHKDVGDSVVSVSIDTDPNEDEGAVIEHLDRYGYEWRFAIDAGGFAKKLVDEFGVQVVNAPATPIVLVCEDGESRLLEFGIKGPGRLKQAIEEGCE